MTSINPLLGSESFCYLTTTGRVSGEPRTIEIWFALREATVYMLSGGRDRSDWVKNLRRNPAVSVRIKDLVFPGRARVVADPEEDALARQMLLEKYAPGYARDLTDWGRTALPIAVDVGD